MSFRSTAVLLAILAVLGAGVYFFEYRPNPDPSGLDPKLQIWKFDDKTVQRVVTRLGDDEQVMQKRADGLWYLEPQDLRADYWRISGTLIRLANMRGSRRVTENPASLAPYGLDNPRAALTLQTPDGVDHTLLIGDKTPNEGGYYAKQPDDNVIWVVGTFNVEDIERFVKEPAYEPTPAPSATPSPEGTPTAATTPGPGDTPGAAPAGTGTPAPATPATPAPPGLPTIGIPATPEP
jgi:hypothetical protein